MRLTPHEDHSAPDEREVLTTAVQSVAHRLISSALWSTGRCTWSIVTGDRSDPWSRRSITSTAGPDLYQGAAGIAVFLTEVLRVQEQDRLAATIEGALQFVFAESSGSGGDVGFYSGLTGRAYALARYGVVSRREQYVELARTLLRRTDAGDGIGDVISGAAGAIPVLLKLGKWLEEPSLESLATELGLRAIATARRWTMGWSWRSVGVANARDLSGYGHGASGYAYAFLELFTHTGEDCFLYAARQAMLYEETCFDQKTGTWLDYRNTELEQALSTPIRLAELRDNLSSSAPRPAYRKRSMNAWCHGASGIGMVRLRAAQLLGDERAREEALLAMDLVSRANAESSNYSLCHGIFGNDEFLLASAKYFGTRELEGVVVARAVAAAHTYEVSKRSWPSGTSNGLQDPSLMVGDAGIGYHLLRLANSDMPSVLFPSVDADPHQSTHGSPRLKGPTMYPSLNDLKSDHIGRFFDRTRRVFAILAPSISFAKMEPMREPLSMLGVSRDINQDLDRIADKTLTSVLLDASALDEAYVEMVDGIRDFTETVLAELSRPDVRNVDWTKCQFCISPFVRLVTQRHDWEAWLSASSSVDLALLPQESRVSFLLLRQNDRVVVHRIGAFAGVVLSLCAAPTTFSQVLQTVTESLSNPSGTDLEGAVLRQVKEAFTAGLIDIIAA